MRLPVFVVASVLAVGEAAQVAAADLEKEPAWPTVTPEYYDYAADPASRVKGRYFTGKYISTTDKVQGGAKVLLRRKFTLKARPKEAYVQGTG